MTVGLPVYDSKDIAWLVMESLCRQRTYEPWELIVCEEEHEGQMGKDFFTSYSDRLKEVNCFEIKYLMPEQKITVSEKWAHIAQAGSENSKMFILCGTDNYYHDGMIQMAANAYRKGHDWLATNKGFFYNFASRKLVLYDRDWVTGLEMAVSMKLAKKIPFEKREKIIDAWVYRKTQPKKPLLITREIKTLCTHGFGHISKNRGNMIDVLKKPFYETDKKLEDIIPNDIVKRVQEQSWWVKEGIQDKTRIRHE